MVKISDPDRRGSAGYKGHPSGPHTPLRHHSKCCVSFNISLPSTARCSRQRSQHRRTDKRAPETDTFVVETRLGNTLIVPTFGSVFFPRPSPTVSWQSNGGKFDKHDIFGRHLMFRDSASLTPLYFPPLLAAPVCLLTRQSFCLPEKKPQN